MKLFYKPYYPESELYETWFAWRPVWAWDGKRLGIVWLENVRRKRYSSKALIKYRYEVLS